MWPPARLRSLDQRRVAVGGRYAVRPGTVHAHKRPQHRYHHQGKKCSMYS